jgi:high affinity Mn2+ porin
MIRAKALAAGSLSFCLAMPLLCAPEAAKGGEIDRGTGERPLPAGFAWDGAYIGGHVAAGFTHVRAAPNDPTQSPWHENSGRGMGGLQAGYNFVLPSRFLWGVEIDATSPSFFEGDDVVATHPSSPGRAVTESLDYVATLRGRFGYLFDHWMVYATGGYARARTNFAESPGITADQDRQTRFRDGYALGAGVEFPIGPDWTARAEYLYTGWGHAGAAFPSGTGVSSQLDAHMLRIGINRMVRWPGQDPESSKDWPAAQFDRWNLHGQYTFVGQGYPSFHSPYEGASSLAGNSQYKSTQSATAYVGLRTWEGGEFYVNPELMQGFGLSNVRGVAAFPNGEAQKSDFPYPRLNIARIFLRQTFGFGGEQETLEDGPNQLASKQDISRLTLTAGKFAVTDYFDGNRYANDPRSNFLNWNVYGGGSYDWTMDKLSWTWGAMADFNQKNWALRAGYFLLPEFSNANSFDTTIPARGEYTLEAELRYSLWGQPGKTRLFGWINHGSMGGYADALMLAPTSANYPDITQTRRVRTNYGGVLNIEQALTSDIGVFSRASWSPGQVEILGWTDTHRAISLGTVVNGTSWNRPEDRIGLAGVAEQLSSVGRQYFAAGGIGILIGDGQLNYRPEKVLETYYLYKLNRWSSVTFDYQYIANPGYNADRGPVSFYSARFHAEF